MKKAFPLPSWILSALGLVLFSALFAYVFRFTWNSARTPSYTDLILIVSIGVCGIFLLRIALMYQQRIQTEASAMDASLLKMIEESSLAGIIYDTNDTIVWVTQAMQALFPQLTGPFMSEPPIPK